MALIQEGFWQIIILTDYAQKQNEDLLLITLDAEQAFDIMSWPFMFKIFNSFDLDKKFSLWLQAIYSNPMSSVKTNGTLSRRFTIQRGTRQGDPLSPSYLLYVLKCYLDKTKK